MGLNHLMHQTAYKDKLLKEALEILDDAHRYGHPEIVGTAFEKKLLKMINKIKEHTGG